MKKLFLISIIFFSTLNLRAEGTQQLFATYSLGINRLFIQNSLMPIYYSRNQRTSIDKIYAIVASDFDINKPGSITLIPQTGFTLTVDLPVDRTSALTSEGLKIQTTKTADGSTCDFVLYIHKINKATIPYSLNFGSAFPYNTATPDFNGWGYRELNNGIDPQLAATTSRNAFFLAFNPSQANDSLICNYYASNNNSQTGLNTSILASPDGISWTSIKDFTNTVPSNNATIDEKRISLLLPVGTQYVKYFLIAKGQNDPNININMISIKRK
jgi:hypothetical protein